MNKETLQNYNERLNTNNSSLGDILETINALPEVSGTLTITENGEHDVKEYEKVVTDVHEITPYSPQFISFYYFKGTDLDNEMISLDTSNMTTMKQMFYGCSGLTRLDVSKFNTSNVTDMQQMFYSCSNLQELDVSNFDVSNVTTMSSMFESCQKLTTIGDISKWDTSKVTNMSSMFRTCKLLDVDFGDLKTDSVTTLANAFSQTNITKLDTSKWNTPNLTDFGYMFSHCTRLTDIDLSGIDLSKQKSLKGLFYGCAAMRTVDISSWDTSNITDISSMFGGNCFETLDSFKNMDVHNVTTVASILQGNKQIKVADMSTWNISNKLTSMSLSFCECSNLEKVNMKGWDCSNVSSTSQMFYRCEKITDIVLGHGKVLPNSSNQTLVGCYELRSIYVPDELLDAYKSATNWSSFGEKLKPYSEIPEDLF